MITAIHIIPIDDTHDHDAVEDCGCDPVVVNPEENIPAYRHNAYDHREVVEAANEILGNIQHPSKWKIITV